MKWILHWGRLLRHRRHNIRTIASWISRNRSGIFLTMGWPLSKHALEDAPEDPALSQHLLCDQVAPADPSEVLQGRRGYAPAPDPLIDRYHFSSRLRHVRPIQKHVCWKHHACLQCAECPHVSPAIAR